MKWDAVMLSLGGAGALWLMLLAFTLHARKRLADLADEPPEIVPTKRNATFQKRLVQAAEQIAAKDDIPPDAPPLVIGEECRFIGGGPILLVVDADATHIIASWDDGQQERKLQRAVVRRYKPHELVWA